jgi:hypothetical protein
MVMTFTQSRLASKILKRQTAPGKGDFCGDEQHRAGAARAQHALRGLTRRGLSERNERSECSEFRGATQTAAEWSRRAAATATA